MIEKSGRKQIERASPGWQFDELGDQPVGRREL